MTAKYSLKVAARAYTWPVDEEQPPLESPEVCRPPLPKQVFVNTDVLIVTPRPALRASSLPKSGYLQTYPVFPSASTAGNGTQPLNTFKYGLNFNMRLPSVVDGTVSAKPTTASWSMTLRGWTAGPLTVGVTAPSTCMEETTTARPRIFHRGAIVIIVWR